jgi:polar amino acid transport system substrate-binding protein
MSTNKIPRVLSLLLLGLAAMPVQALQLVTEEYPPFNYTEGKTLKGLSTQVAAEMGVRANIPMDFHSMAWRQAYGRAQSKQNTCIYSTVRLENRERIFKWVGPIATDTWGLYAKNAFSGEIKTLADARPYRIGAVTDDYKVEWLKQKAITNIDTVDVDKKNPPRLTLDRKELGGIDLWVASIYSAREVAESAKAPDIKLVLKINEQELWLACNPGVPNVTVKALQGALDGMKKNGTYKKIADSYAKRLAK